VIVLLVGEEPFANTKLMEKYVQIVILIVQTMDIVILKLVLVCALKDILEWIVLFQFQLDNTVQKDSVIMVEIAL